MLDTLGAFQSENEPVQKPVQKGVVVASRVPQSITVASILARNVSLEWFEATAISQSVCAKLVASGDADGTARLDGERVSIDAAGQVHIAAARKSSGASALSQVAELLGLMLSTATVPAPLRLALSQANVASSLEEWSKGIAYYERPGRELLIQEVYRRAIAVPVPTTEPASEPTPVMPPPPVVQKPARPGTTAPTFRRFVPALVLTVVVAALAAAAVWFVLTRNPASSARGAEGPPTLQSTFNNAADAMGSLVGQIPGLRESQPAQVDPPPSPPTGRWIHLPSGRLMAVEASPMPSPPIARSIPVAIGGPSPAVIVSPRPLTASLIPQVTYSASDAGVIPPVAVYPQFPSQFPPYITDDDFAEFDVIVTEVGSVESVRARRVPPTMTEAVRMTMSLSAAKTWRFRPGTKDGEPVRYRQVIRVLKN